MEAFSEAFGNRSVNLVADPNKQWFVLSSSICSCQPSKFLSRSALVQKFPLKFTLVKLVVVKERRHGSKELWRRVRRCSFSVCVFCVVTRRTIKPSKVSCYRWVIDIINYLKIDLGSEREQDLNSPTSEETTILCSFSTPGQEPSKLF